MGLPEGFVLLGMMGVERQRGEFQGIEDTLVIFRIVCPVQESC